MDDVNKGCLIFVIFVICGMLLMVAICLPFEINRGKACKDLGFYQLSHFNKKAICEDYDNNIHFVKFDCTGFIFNVKCTAKQISIGGVFEIEN